MARLLVCAFALDAASALLVGGALQRQASVAKHRLELQRCWATMQVPQVEEATELAAEQAVGAEEVVGRVQPTRSPEPKGVVDKFPEDYWQRVLERNRPPKTPIKPTTGGSGKADEKDLMQKVKDAGAAGVISYIFWEWAFWGVSVPVAISAFYGLQGHFPDFSNQEDLTYLGGEAFAFVNLARFAVPLRIGLALGTTPWVQANIVDRFNKDKKDKK